MRVALYARVSTKDKGQNTDNQIDPLRTHVAEQPNWEIVREYVEHESASGKAHRSQFISMLADAESDKFDLVLFWALDRFSREGVTNTLFSLQRLTRAGVGWKSYKEPFLDTTSLGPFKDVVVAVIAAIASMESERRSERVKAGLEKRRKDGKPIGGRRIELDETRLATMFEQGYTKAAMAAHLGVSRGTIINRVKQLGLQSTQDMQEQAEE